VLSRYLAIPPREWVFSTNVYGKPDIVNSQAKEACLSFNISHTHSLIVLAITKCRALGVDVENFHTRAAPIDVADHYFTPHEVAALATMPPQQQQYRFFESWTFKESYIKARGLGLSLPLDRFGFRFPHEQAVEIAIDPELGDDPARWQFWQLRPRQEYLLAICAERDRRQSPCLIVREAIPMLSEKQIPVEVLRFSTFERLHCP
jgi:4'-phosphopantetheinyl transferase